MSSEDVQFQCDAGLATITLNRPEQLNALSPELILALRPYIDEIAAREDVHCVILRGAGASFCSGYDLKARERARSLLPPGFTAGMISALAALPQPVIAAVRGHCFTGGLELALAADIIIAAESARFADTHAKWGMRAAWGLTQRLPRRIGASAAKELMFTGRELNGKEALALGLANRCVADEALEEEIKSCAAAIMARAGPAIRWIKEQVDATAHLSLAEGLAHEAANRPSSTQEADVRLKDAGWKR
jgi:enoyl-CoA hydratase